MAGDIVRWIDPAGATWTLLDTDDTVRIGWGMEGRHMPPVDLLAHEVPYQAGARLDRVKVGPREVTLPLIFKAATEAALRDLLRLWMHRLDPTLGDGQLEVLAAGVGAARRLTCRYAGGMELVESTATYNFTRQKAVAVFRALDPYWYDAATNVTQVTLGAVAAFFPILPISLANPNVFADAVISNDGDAEAWPVLAITGPGVAPSIANLTTGKTVALTSTLAAGETITVDTRPGRKTVVDQTGANRFADLTAASALWALAVGANQLRIQMTGATASSLVQVSWQRRWLSA